MKKIIFAVVVLMAFAFAFALGFRAGIKDVILHQEVWEVDEVGYIEYRGEIHEYDTEV